MKTPSGNKPGDSFPSNQFLSGWCPECGRRRGADARCRNCDPWWTSALVQAGVPAVLGMLFLVTTVSTLSMQAQKPRPSAVLRSESPARLLTVKVKASQPSSQLRIAPAVPVLSSVSVPAIDPAAEVLRVQREGAYINAVLRAQDEARRAQEFAARNRAHALALQQRMQAISQMRAQNRYSYAAPVVPRNQSSFSSPANIEEAVTGETVVVPF